MVHKLLTPLLYLTLIANVIPATAQLAIEQIPVPGTTTSLAVNPLSNKIYVASISSSEESSVLLSLLDGRTKKVLQSLTLGFDTPGKVIVNPVSGKVYMQACNFLFVPNPVCDLLIFDNALNRLADLPNSGPAVAVNPRTDRIYILNESGFAILNGRTNQIVGEIPLPGAGGVAVDPLRERLFVLVNNTELVVVDLRSNRIRDRVLIEPGADSIGINPLTQRAYITHPNFVNIDPTQLTVLDTNNFHIITHISVGPTPRNVSVDFRSNTVFVGNDDSLTVIDADKNTRSFEIENATSADPDLATGLIYATTDLVFFDDNGVSGRVDVFAVPRNNGGRGQD